MPYLDYNGLQYYDSKIKYEINKLNQVLDSTIVSRLIDFENNNTDVLVGDLSKINAYAKMGRCNLADNGTVNAWYGDNGYSETGSNGQVMVWVPKFYANEDLYKS